MRGGRAGRRGGLLRKLDGGAVQRRLPQAQRILRPRCRLIYSSSIARQLTTPSSAAFLPLIPKATNHAQYEQIFSMNGTLRMPHVYIFNVPRLQVSATSTQLEAEHSDTTHGYLGKEH